MKDDTLAIGLFGLAASCAFVIAVACSDDGMSREEMEQMMFAAVKTENYELAAVIRDELKRL